MSESVVELLSPEVVESYDRLRGDCGAFEPEVGVLELAGDDRKGWLQGQATNNLRSLDMGASSAFCLCSPTGQMLSVCEVWSIANRFFLTVPRETMGAVLERVESMVIMEDVRATDVTGAYRLLSVQGPAATRALEEHIPLPKLDAGEAEFDGVGVILLRSNRTGLGGWDVLFPAEATAALSKLSGAFAPILPEAYEIARLEAGIPAFGKDMTERTLPPEMGPAFEARTISYTKGCYTGQEVLMRIHSRGHTNKTWVGLLSEHPLEADAIVSHGERADAGRVTSAAFSPDYGFIGAAMLRNEAASNREIVRVQTSKGDVEAEVRPMPILRFE